MKDKILRLIDNALAGSEDNLFRAKMQFGNLDEEQLQKEYGQSGRTRKQVYQEYIDDKAEKQAMKDWFLRNT